MKVSWVRGLLVLITFFCLALKKDDIVELEQYFNARYSADFLKTTDNVKFVMPPGTKGRVESFKKFNSGNYGLFVELQSGANKGEKVWVYYKTPPADPGMKLYSGSDEAVAEETAVVESATSMVTTKETLALRAPASDKPHIPLVVTKEHAAKMLEQMDKAKEEIKKVENKNSQKPCDEDCKLAQATYSRDNGIPDKPAPKKAEVVQAAKPALAKNPPTKKVEEVISAPVEPVKFVGRSSAGPPVLRNPARTENPYGLGPISCVEETKGLTYQMCRSLDRNLQEEGFRIVNGGPNKIVSGTGGVKDYNRYREFRFSYVGQARQDIQFSVLDSNGTNSQSQESVFMLFPRETLPHVRSQNGQNIVTLPTGETVSFDSRTNQITGGVLSEDAPSRVGPGIRAAKISYGGKGVMIQAVGQPGKDPRRPVGDRNVTITKQGKKCVVPKKELWPDQRESSPMHFKYFSDKDFDSYLQRRCKFGLY
ncbi:hypothetical protein [Bdellovibrio sp. HCB2-146]|uniref:hypothetical protein n=1 Tax=Bdellovibrio sp. HCB2-146 TaxID=3394362 RepID=UPI0039BC9C23